MIPLPSGHGTGNVGTLPLVRPPDRARWIASNDRVPSNVASCYRTRGDDGSITYSDTWSNKGLGCNPCPCANLDCSDEKGTARITCISTCATQKCTLAYDTVFFERYAPD